MTAGFAAKGRDADYTGQGRVMAGDLSFWPL